MGDIITPDLLDRIKAASATDRLLDLAISVAINFADVFDPQYEWMWSPMGDEIEGHKDGKRRACLDPAQFVPHWTGSLDCAVRLVPAEWFWRVGYTSYLQAWASVNQTHPDHGEEGRNEFFFTRKHHERKSTPVLALAHCALSAREAIASKKARANV